MMTFENNEGTTMCVNIWWSPEWGFHKLDGAHSCVGLRWTPEWSFHVLDGAGVLDAGFAVGCAGFPKGNYSIRLGKWVDYPEPLIYTGKWLEVEIGEGVTEVYDLLDLAPGWRAFVRHPVGWQQEAL